MKIFTVLVLLAISAGCSQVQDRIVTGVAVYCAAPPERRALYRAGFNAQMPAGHGVKIDCPLK